MKSRFEFQLDRLDEFRFALSQAIRKYRQSGEVVHGLALQVGAWLGKKYAPLPYAREPCALPRRGQTQNFLPLLHGVVRGGNAVVQIPTYPWRARRLENNIHSAQMPPRVSANFGMAALVKHKVVSYPGIGTYRTHSRAVSERGLRSFAPPPATDKSARLGLVKMPTQAHASARKMVSQTEESELSLPLTDGVGLVAESVTKRRGLMAFRTDEQRLTAGFSASGSGDASGADFDDALEEYFFRQSRLAPSGGTAFDPRLSPLWAGLKLPA